MPVLKTLKNGVWVPVSGISEHTHTKNDITDFPESLPADGGNADTLGGKTAEEFAAATDLENLRAQLTQSDWEQTDDTQLDYIKNKPFGSFGFEEVAIGENLNFFYNLGNDMFIAGGGVDIDPNLQYKIILNGVEYFCTPQLDKKGNYCLGNVKNSLYNTVNEDGSFDVTLRDWNEGEPFCLVSGSILIVKSPAESSYIMSVYSTKEIIKTLDKKYFDYAITGEKTSGKVVTYEGEEYTCEDGAEIFNDYLYNLAIGSDSHAEGSRTKAIGFCSHAEGSGNTASGDTSHVEGSENSAIGLRSHVEGLYNIAIGRESHVQGRYNVPDNETIIYYQPQTTANKTWEASENEVFYLLTEAPIYDNKNKKYIVNEFTEILGKDLQVYDLFLESEPLDNFVTQYHKVTDIKNPEQDETTGEITYIWAGETCRIVEYTINKYAHIVGNGTTLKDEHRSNAHTLDWDGNAWFAGDVYVGSTSGVNKDEGSKKLATEDFVTDAIEAIPTPDVSGQISEHNTDANAHADIRNSISATEAALSVLLNGTDPETIDGVNDLINYVNEHGSEVTGIKADIKENADNIEQLSALVGDTSVSNQISEAVAQKSQVQIITWGADD